MRRFGKGGERGEVDIGKRGGGHSDATGSFTPLTAVGSSSTGSPSTAVRFFVHDVFFAAGLGVTGNALSEKRHACTRQAFLAHSGNACMRDLTVRKSTLKPTLASAWLRVEKTGGRLSSCAGGTLSRCAASYCPTSRQPESHLSSAPRQDHPHWTPHSREPSRPPRPCARPRLSRDCAGC